MIYLGDFPADQAIYFAWNTNDADGASITRSGDGTISVYKDASNGTAFDTTQTTTGVTNDEDFDSLTGMHTCCITTTNAWYETGHDYIVVLSTSTIDTQTVNSTLAHFSIENRYMVGTDSANTTTPPTAAQNAIAVWDRVLTGATHNIATSAGRRLREVGAYAIHSGTAQAGNSVHITLAATASSDDGVYNRNLLVIVGGTGAGQTRTIVDYNGTSKIALADRDWRVHPDSTSEYQIVPDDTPLVVDHGLVVAGTSNTITLRSYASSVNDTYIGGIVTIVAGTARGESQIITGYNGTSKVATMCGNWTTTPNTSSVYVLMPYGVSAVSCISDSAVDSIIDEAIDGTHTLREILRLLSAYAVGKSSGGGTATITFRDIDDTKDRIVATVTTEGNRTATTLTED